MTELIRPKTLRRASIAMAALMTTTILAGGGVLASHAWSANTEAHTTAVATPQPSAALADQRGFADLVDKVKSAVVNIAMTETPDHVSGPVPQLPPNSPFAELFHRFSQNQSEVPRHGLGSGFIISPDGYIVTNNHVVDHARKLTVTLSDGSSYPASVKGRDPKTDLALIKIDTDKTLSYVSFGDSDKARVGNWVIAVGNPFGLGGTVTAGIVSAHDRNLNDGPYDDFLQIDAPINPGNSGGPLFNQAGQVIGIDTAILSPNGGGSIGIGFAIPSNLASKVIAQLREHGTVERGWLGVEMQPMTATLAKALGRPNADGVLVDRVETASPAARAGLEQGDVIAALDGTPIQHPRDLALTVANRHPGEMVTLTVWRGGHDRTIDVAIGRLSQEHVASNQAPATGGPVGLALAPLSAVTRDQLGLGDAVQGVMVAEVKPGSPAAESGLEPGDVIVKIGNHAVTTPTQAVQQIHDAERGKKEAVPVLVMRNGSTYYLALELKAA
jgi:serine protease Do